MAKLDHILQKDILQIMLSDIKALNRLSRIITPDLFTANPYRFLCRSIFEHFKKFGETPSKKTILIEINKKINDNEKNHHFKARILPIFTRKVEAPKFLENEIREWAEKQQFGRLLEQAAKYGSEDELEKAKNLLKSSFLFDISKRDFEIFSLLEEWSKRQKQRRLESNSKDYKLIRTRLGTLDDLMQLKTSESILALLMGTSGVGKSIFSINFGVFGLQARCNVAHFVFENTAKQTLARYDSRLVKYPYINLKNYKWTRADLAIANMLMSSLRRNYRGSLKVIHSPINTTSVSDIESLLREIEIVDGWKPNFIVYDSGDHMVPSSKTESYRLGVKQVYTDIKRQTEIRNIPILSTTHAKASARGTRVRQESFSESYDKARLADIVLTISQTQEQEDDRQAEIWLDKNRDSEGKYGILVDLLFRMMSIRFVENVDVRSTDGASGGE